MWLVKLSLKKTYTIGVLAVLIFFLGFFTLKTTPTDIFPEINIPVVVVSWQYLGLVPTDMANYITTFSDYQIANYVDGVKRIDSNIYFGFSVSKIYFQPYVDISMAVAEITAVLQPIIKRMPPGTTPPLIFKFNASSVPVLQIAVSSSSLSEPALYDYTIWQLRRDLLSVKGTMFPPPWGGIVRWMTVDLDPHQLLARGISAQDAVDALTGQVLNYPSGDVKIGDRDYFVTLNNVPKNLFEINDFPIKRVFDTDFAYVRRNINDRVIYFRDVGTVHDGGVPQVNLVRLNGVHGILMTTLKTMGASTIQIVDQIKSLLPEIRKANPDKKIQELFDQSIFVRAAIKGVVFEAGSAAILTGLMILLFLRSPRSSFIVLTSIPLCIFVALFLLKLLGHTLNLMTLGGLALAVGILVDDATVAIENIHRNKELGKPPLQSIMDGSQQIALPALVATLSISIVFTSVIFLDGPPRYLFIPMALAVVFALLFSYVLSRSLVPAMVLLLESKEDKESRIDRLFSFFYPIQASFYRNFERLRLSYATILRMVLCNRKKFYIGVFFFITGSLLTLPFIGRDFFPTVDAGIMRLHVYTPTGTRLEKTEEYFSRIEASIKKIIPPAELETMVDNTGLPIYFMATLAMSDSMNQGSFDGEIMINLKEKHRPTAFYMKKIRKILRKEFPDCIFFFQPADMVNQVLNFGVPAPIDIQVIGTDDKLTYQFALESLSRIKEIPGIVDGHIHQRFDYPTLHLEVDKVRAVEMGLFQIHVANNVLNQLSTSYMVKPTYWPDPKTTINYPLLVFSPQMKINSINDLLNFPLTSITTPFLVGASPPVESTQTLLGNVLNPELLANVAKLIHTTEPAMVSHSTMKPVFDILCNVQDRDLGAVASDIEKKLDPLRKKLPPLYRIILSGQASSMNSAFQQLEFGILFAIILVYLLMVVNFQSWREPFIVLTALPIGACGVLWMLFLTRTTFSVPSLMGILMAVGVITSNSILLITFANQRVREGLSPLEASLEAGFTRFRPICMTALAMIIGMLPMSLGLSEGGEQYIPLGRAVIGGLLLGTAGTLFFVPSMFTTIRQRKP
ncbi:efflux RND transporter permease subunit [Candidatus Methylacidiphilum infernorum]|uniref:Cation/multidrug efflux pump n=1 Tax=Methylacidiphilum infernorum (isolate V4) TaxID=481448 RepID=B3DXB9_METI4|nr:efflux RND transporter permease subunit [Candidatus Methylacidiphilum infernorum]ACD83828.1 Cation/multidrug efflux pump [Methylacidiphilum infernorum V4]